VEKLKTPLAIINFKAFSSAIGENAVVMAKLCEKEAKLSGITVGVAVQPADIFNVVNNVSIPVFAQHVDAVFLGAFTGSVLVESVVQAGVVGSLVNHSEHPVDLAAIKKTVLRLHDVDVLAVACAGTAEMAFEIAKFSPDFVVIEPPELIGGNIAVSQARPEVITAITKNVKRCPVLCGAGIKTKVDVEKAIALGAKGILVASGVCLAKNPASALRDLLAGFK